MTIRIPLLASMLMSVALLVPITVTSAADAPDPAIGTWKLNVGKSKLDPSMGGVKSAVRTYSASPGGMTVSQTTVDASGAGHEGGSSFTYDGKRHPVHGVDGYDTVAVKRVGSNESKSDLFLGDKLVGHLTRVVSKDGKSMTITSDYTDSKGNKLHDVAMYDRQ
jgi:hypothetical protein